MNTTESFDNNPVLWTMFGVMAMILFVVVISIGVVWLDPYAAREREDALIVDCITQGHNPAECAAVFRQTPE